MKMKLNERETEEKQMCFQLQAESVCVWDQQAVNSPF